MNAIHIRGKQPLYGEVKIQGSKNAVLPILAATVLIKGTCIIRKCPDISDVSCMLKLLQSIGCVVTREDKDVSINALHIQDSRLPKEYVTGMRSSVMLMGALLSRTKEVSLDYPGGCIIGDRPIDIHIEALKQLGAHIWERDDRLYASACELRGNRVVLRFPSVGATENTILAAVMAKGITQIGNCAKEPEIIALCRFLRKAGARISGEGTSVIIIEGVEELNPIVFETDTDRIVAGTYLLATIGTGGEVILRDAPIAYMTSVLETAKCMGCELRINDSDIQIKMRRQSNPISLLQTDIYPGFPTDLQSMLLVALSSAAGDSVLEETIFNNRFHVAEELNRMGAAIRIDGASAYIKGRRKLYGRSVIARDLRGGAALIGAGLIATGDTFVNNICYIERGYEDICRDYRLLGASVRRYREEAEEISTEEICEKETCEEEN